MTDCDEATAVAYTAIFKDTTVYANQALDEVLCELKQGDARPGASSGFAHAGEFSFSGPTTYEIWLGGFSSECGGAESGYVSVDESDVRGTTTWLVPLRTVFKPPV